MNLFITILLCALFCSGTWSQDRGYKFPPVDKLPVIEELPDPFMMEDGSRVVSQSDWKKQQEYLKAMIQHYEYGFRPPVPKDVTIKEVYSNDIGWAIEKELLFTITTPGGGKIPFSAGMRIPKEVGPFPIVIKNDRDINRIPASEEGVKRGYIMMDYRRTDLDPDLNLSQEGNLGAAQKAYPDYNWATLQIWSWGYSVIIDWLETQKYVDISKIVVTGQSRGGKTALLAGAMDERIALTVPCGSGAGGAGNFRFGNYRDYSDSSITENEGYAEPLHWVALNFTHWFVPELATFRDDVNRLQFDSHTIKALIAPRALLCTDALGDAWANPWGNQQTSYAAKEVFDWMGVPRNIANHYRTGGHSQNEEDIIALLDYADYIFKDKALPVDYFKENFPVADTLWTWKAPLKKVFTELSGDYLGQKLPGMSVEMFAPEIISTSENYELNSVFSPKGNEFIFTRGKSSIGSGNIMIMKRANNVWSEPEVISFCRDYPGVDPSLSPDGNIIFYSSGRPLSGTGAIRSDHDLWMAFREGDGWSNPVHLGNEINTAGKELYPVFTAKGHLYWQANRPGTIGGGDIWRATFKNGVFTEIVNAGPAINTPGGEGDVYVSPDEDYLIVVSGRKGQGLHISFKQDGQWMPAINMGTTINKGMGEFCPMVSPDGKYFFYTAKNNNKGDIYWISTDFFETLRKE